ncbi:E3 UFM1-protein ligase 1-like protein [Acropora cervicornis]|uniref:E3 UFM1-protein ligase 1-like protein n=1 Tax=Acropora cervicornis TaxID=6130 RepID=A0AAD9PY27_ACRCE|nr:E3 UFM1-protein ligase 1-like protein [Acropora cervicornis]
MADWEEIKRLAADFQRAQLSSTAHKLSERNCVEIVQKLIHLGLIEVIYTTDGKEYLTPQQLEREIKDELFVHGGRINVVDLQQLIGVDFSHVEKKVIEMESGQISIAELSKKFTFPTEFLLEIVESHLGTVIHGQLDMLDRGVLFTESFVAQQTACIRGVFSAITKPTTLSSLIAEYGFHEKLLYVGINKLCREGRISGSIQGNLFVPGIYSKSQMAWVDEFFKQNEYIEYDALPRLGITEGSQYLKKRFQKYQVKFLPTCCVGESLVNQVEIAPLLPSPCTSGDAARLLQDIFKSSVHSLAHVFCESIAVSDRFLQNCKDPFQQLMQDKAKTTWLPWAWQEEGARTNGNQRRKKGGRRQLVAGVKVEGAEEAGGGGRGGRESKTQKVRDKKKDRSTKDEGLDDESKSKQNQSELPFMSVEEISEELQKRCPSCSDDFIEEIANYLYRPLTQSYQEVARSVFLSTGKQRKSHSEVQSKVNVLWANAKLFDKGIKLFTDDVQVQLSRHLLKTVCADIVNLAVSLLAAEHMITIKDDSAITPEERLKIISKLPEKIRPGVVKLNMTLNGKETDEFFTQFELICGPDYCEFMLKKLDKKRERQLSLERRCALQEQLRQEIDPAMALHLVSAVLFQHHTGCNVTRARLLRASNNKFS